MRLLNNPRRGHVVSFVLAEKEVCKQFFFSLEKYGDKLEMNVDDRGMLEFQGLRFIGFEKYS